ncbi:hypothetical protein Vadar_020442 [Vaccinium darrowii]|uniref:Uncharacterized protein n=1 Tax=Vaccinium darrowii TaxID=229202 RepID=A0ACB7Y7V6_9ERIC|nr:hypothetical protein Vadar_020442 [Vaccinium darrowii]
MPKVDNVESNGLKSLLIENFSTREELIDRVRNVASMEGYVTTIRRSKVDHYVVIGCDRGGKYCRASVPLDERKRISASRLINCPFEIKGKKKVGKRWKVEIKNASHNYEPSSEMSEHPYCRHFSQEEEKEYVLNYLKNTWLPFKDRFVNAWTWKHPHFGNRVTSRTEGAHAMLKRYLTVSTDSPVKGTCFHVSIFALGELFKQYELARADYVLGPCTGNFSRTMGLPCAHMMRNTTKDETLLLGDIHPQWRIDTRSFTVDSRNGSEIECLLKNFHDNYKNLPLAQKEDSHKQIAQLVDSQIPLTLEPNLQPHKGRPLSSKKRKGDSSTTRHPSAFEIAKKTRKCGACHRVGHNIRTCPRKGESNSLDPHFVLANQHVTLNVLETP